MYIIGKNTFAFICLITLWLFFTELYTFLYLFCSFLKILSEIYFHAYKMSTFYSVIYTQDKFCDVQEISNVLSIGQSNVSYHIFSTFIGRDTPILLGYVSAWMTLRFEFNYAYFFIHLYDYLNCFVLFSIEAHCQLN